MDFKNANFAKIKYGDKEYYVVDCFEHKGRKYYFIMENFYVEGKDDLEKYNNTHVEANFIYKIYDHYYNNVDDDKLYKELFGIVTKRIFLQKNKYFKGLYKDNKNV